MNLSEQVISNFLEFYMDINDLKGINEEKLANLENSLLLLKNEYSNKDHVPKEIASLFIDIYSSIESLSYLYTDKERNNIIQTADYLANLARSICLQKPKEPIV